MHEIKLGKKTDSITGNGCFKGTAFAIRWEELLWNIWTLWQKESGTSDCAVVSAETPCGQQHLQPPDHVGRAFCAKAISWKWSAIKSKCHRRKPLVQNNEAQQLPKGLMYTSEEHPVAIKDLAMATSLELILFFLTTHRPLRLLEPFHVDYDCTKKKLTG